jgi:hypothetical protein
MLNGVKSETLPSYAKLENIYADILRRLFCFLQNLAKNMKKRQKHGKEQGKRHC